MTFTIPAWLIWLFGILYLVDRVLFWMNYFLDQRLKKLRVWERP